MAYSVRKRRHSPFKALITKERAEVRDKAMGITRRNQALNGLENARRSLPGQIPDAQKRGKTQAEIQGVRSSGDARRGIPGRSFGDQPGIREQGQAIRRGADLSAKKIGAPGQGWKINQNKNSPRFGKRYKESGEGGSVHTYAPLSFSKSHKFVVPPNRAKKSGGSYGSAASAVAGKMAQAKQRAKQSTPTAGLPMNPRTQGWGQGRPDKFRARIGQGDFSGGRPMVPRPGQAGRRTLPTQPGATVDSAFKRGRRTLRKRGRVY